MLETHPQPSLEELSKYYDSDDYISHTGAKRNLLEQVYHIVKSIALKRKLKLINKVSNGGKQLLDVGCGTGDFLKISQQNSWSVTGIEPNAKARSMAWEKVGDLIFDETHIIKLEKKSFDVITLWHVLEHLPNINDQIKNLNALLKPNGTLIIAVPNFKSHDAIYYREFWAAYDAPRHLWHFSKNSISKLVSLEHLSVVEIIPMKFDAFYVSLLSEKYKSGKMNVMKAFKTGWRSNQLAKTSKEYSSLIYVIKKS